MKNTWLQIAQIIVPVIVGVVLVPVISNEFDKSLEQARPLIAEETLRRQNYLNSKRDAYYEAIEILSRYLSEVPLSPAPEERPIAARTVNEAEVNAAKAKLALYADNEAVVQYDSFFVATPNLIRTLDQFISVAREDMGYSKQKLPYKYRYTFLGRHGIADSHQSR